MPNMKNAEKKILVDKKREETNNKYSATMKSSIKKVEKQLQVKIKNKLNLHLKELLNLLIKLVNVEQLKRILVQEINQD